MVPAQLKKKAVAGSQTIGALNRKKTLRTPNGCRQEYAMTKRTPPQAPASWSQHRVLSGSIAS
jgi:hypothetical protein